MNLVINCNFIIVLVLLCTLTVDHLWSTGGEVCAELRITFNLTFSFRVSRDQTHVVRIE